MIADHARAAAARGFHIFPCLPGDKRPAIKEWETRASTDPARITTAWEHSPASNIGLACGPANLVVLDLDTPKNGEPGTGRDTFAALVAKAGEDWPATYAVSTPSGGEHLYFTAPPGAAIRNSAGKLGPLVDVRASGGYVVAAGSVTPAGAYELLDDMDPQPLPGWLAELLTAPPKVEAAPRSSLDLAEGERVHAGPIPYGQHHAKLVAYAGWLRFKGYPLREAEACMLMRLGDCEQPPGADRRRYTEAEALAELHDVYGRYSPGDSELLATQNGQAPAVALTGRRIVLTPASGITPEPVVWAWEDGGEGRIPAGSLGLFAGREGTGKSCCLIWFAAKVTKGELPGSLDGPRAVIYVAVEDSWKYTIVPRLVASGANLDLVYRAEVEVIEGETVSLSLPADNALLERVIGERGVAMVVLDPLMSAISDSLDTHVNRQVRQALDPLARLADRTGAVIAGVAHFNKSTGTDASSLITASGAFKDVARFIFAFATDDERGTHVITQTKNSLGRNDLPSLSYQIVTALVPTPKGSAQVGKFELGAETDRSVRDILAAHGEHGEKTRAEEFLRTALADGPRPTKDVEEEAREAYGISKRTLERARGDLRIPSAKRADGWWISLPIHEGDLRNPASAENQRPAKTANCATPPSPGSLGGVGGEGGKTAKDANPPSPWRSGGVGGVAGASEALWWCDECDSRHPLGEHDSNRKEDDDAF
jgi:Bifunctional DNA primase/polymerase, N-terminal/AAA domain